LGKERGEPLGAFAVAIDTHDRIICPPVVMDVAEIDKVRKESRSGSSDYSPWVKWWDRMACKTVARRLFAEMPLAGDARDELERTFTAEEAQSVEESTAAVPALANLPDVDPADEVVEGEVVDEGEQGTLA
jgi:recombinational DNA repair protein RecT